MKIGFIILVTCFLNLSAFTQEIPMGSVSCFDKYMDPLEFQLNYIPEVPMDPDNEDGIISYFNQSSGIRIALVFSRKDIREFNTVQSKFFEWMRVAKDNNVDDMNKEITPQVEKVLAGYIAFYNQWEQQSFFINYLFRVIPEKNGPANYLIMRYRTVDDMNSCAPGNVVVFSHDNVQSLNDYFSNERMEKYRKESREKQQLDELFTD